MSDQEIKERVRKIIFDNMVIGYSRSAKKTFHYTKPSVRPYSSQYFWDSCFHSLILSALGEYKMAEEHLKSLFSLQEEDGFVGHIIYWNKIFPNRITDIFQSRPGLGWRLFRTHSSALIQPPMVAQTVYRIYEDTKDLDFIRLVYPKMKSYYKWLSHNRDFDDDGLLSIISPFESGMDWKPTFDEVVGFKHGRADWRLFLKMVGVDFRNFVHNYDLKTIYHKNYFIVKEVLFNTIYFENLRVMEALGNLLNDPEKEWYDRQAKKVMERMIEVMYDEKDAAFYDLYGKENRKIKVLTPTIFFPVVMESMPEEISKSIISRHLLNNEEFEVPFPIPSVARNDPSFNPEHSMYIWRGPTWIVYNWYLYHFLKNKGYEGEATVLLKCIKSLIEKSGFREYYNTFTGEGYGVTDFTWTGLILDMMRKEVSDEVMN